MLQAVGAEATRLEVYQTAPGSDPEACQPEKQLLLDGSIHAIAFTSTAEVGVCLPLCSVPVSACESMHLNPCCHMHSTCVLDKLVVLRNRYLYSPSVGK